MGLELEHGAGRVVGQLGLAGQVRGGELAGAFEEQHGSFGDVDDVDLGVLAGVGFGVHEIAEYQPRVTGAFEFEVGHHQRGGDDRVVGGGVSADAAVERAGRVELGQQSG